MAGQFCSLERKSIDQIALAIIDGNVRAMQRFLSDTTWETEKMIAKCIIVSLMMISGILMVP